MKRDLLIYIWAALLGIVIVIFLAIATIHKCEAREVGYVGIEGGVHKPEIYTEKKNHLHWEIIDYLGFSGHEGVSYWQNTLTLKGEKDVSKKIYLGGRLDYTRYSWGNRLGLGALVGVDIAKSRNLRFYTEGYGGFAIGNGWQNLQEQHNHLLKPGPYGIFGAEVGIGYKKFTVGIGYDHTSSLKSGDYGLNTFGPRIGWRW